MPAMPKGNLKNFKKNDQTGYEKEKKIEEKPPSFQGNLVNIF